MTASLALRRLYGFVRPPRFMLRGMAAVVFLATLLLADMSAAQTIILEMRQGAFDDERVRKAVIVSANWHRLAAQGGVEPDGIVLRSGRRENEIAVRRPDIASARRLLAEAGYGGERPLQHFILFEAPLEKMALAVAAALKDIGLVSQLQVVTPQTRDQVIAATRYVTGRQTIELPYLLLAQELRAAVPPPRLADLAVVGRPAADYDAKERILTLSVTVANLGAAPAGPHALVVVERSRTLEFPPIEIAGLAPRESRSFKTGLRVPEALLGQEIDIMAITDAERTIPESDEGNNRSDPLTVALPAPPRLPDLVVAGPPEAAFMAETGELLVAVTVANLSSAEAGPHRLALIDQSRSIKFPPLAIEGLAGRESLRLQTRVPIPASMLGRELVLQAEIDFEARVGESDEDNNRSKAVAFTLPATPRRVDLLVAGPPQISFDPQSRDLTVTLAIANRGNTAAGPHRVIIVDRSDTLRFAPLQIDSLGPREKRDVRSSLRVPEEALGRTLLIFAEIDPEAQVRESDESNNLSEQRRFTLPAPPPLPDFRPIRKPERLPDLSVSRQIGVDFDPRTRRITLDLSVDNRGRLEAGPNRVVITELGNLVDIPAAEVPALRPGESRRIRIQDTLPEAALGQDLRLLATVDPDDRLQETDEANNRSEVVSHPLPAAPGTADLTITALHIDHRGDGALAEVRLTVANRGANRSPATELDLRVEGEGAWERLPVPALDAGALWQTNWSVPLTPAVFGRNLSVAIFVDPENAIAEEVETNNRRQENLAVPTPPQTWIVLGGLATVMLLSGIWLLRTRPGRRKPEVVPLRLSYRAQRDAGAQELLRHGEKPAVVSSLALRPQADPGTQSVSLGGR